MCAPGRDFVIQQRSTRVKAVYTELHRSHDPQFFLVRGVVKRTTEQPERADRLLAGLKAGKHASGRAHRFRSGPAGARSTAPNICALWRRPGTHGSRSAIPAPK